MQQNSAHSMDFLIGNPVLLMKISDLGFSVRTTNILENEGIKYVVELLAYRDAELLKLPNFSSICFRDVNETLQKIWLSKPSDGYNVSFDYNKSERPSVPLLDDLIPNGIAEEEKQTAQAEAESQIREAKERQEQYDETYYKSVIAFARVPKILSIPTSIEEFIAQRTSTARKNSVTVNLVRVDQESGDIDVSFKLSAKHLDALKRGVLSIEDLEALFNSYAHRTATEASHTIESALRRER